MLLFLIYETKVHAATRCNPRWKDSEHPVVYPSIHRDETLQATVRTPGDAEKANSHMVFVLSRN